MEVVTQFPDNKTNESQFWNLLTAMKFKLLKSKLFMLFKLFRTHHGNHHQRPISVGIFLSRMYLFPNSFLSTRSPVVSPNAQINLPNKIQVPVNCPAALFHAVSSYLPSTIYLSLAHSSLLALTSHPRYGKGPILVLSWTLELWQSFKIFLD